MAPIERKRFWDWGEARDFFNDLPREHPVNDLLRGILANESPALDVSQMDDHDVREELASRVSLLPRELETRGFRLWRRETGGGLPDKKAAPPEPPKPEPPKPIKSPKAKTWIKFRVRDDVMEEPIPGVQLQVKLPDGSIKFAETDKKGEASFKKIDRGTCDVSCDLKGAKRKTTLDYVSIAPGPDEWGPPEIPVDQRRYKPASYIIAHVENHKVQTGESIESLANANDMTWQDLSIFNWGTSVPKEINKHLLSDVGVTARAPDGINWSFRSTDNPGIVYIPTPWKAEGLATEQTHEIRVKKDNEFLIILENMKELRIPESEYEATFSDGTVRKGTTGKNGADVVVNPPMGGVTIEWKDFDAIESKSLAACARKACDDRNPRDLYRLLEHSPKMIQLVIAAYDKYYNDYTGKGLIEDIYAEVTDPIALSAVELLMLKAGLQPKSGAGIEPEEEE